MATGHALDEYGIVPRSVPELVDVVPAAFIHFGFGHVAANSVPLLVLGFLAALGGMRRFAAVCALIIVADGLGVWLISPATPTRRAPPASVFGLFGYLVVSGLRGARGCWASRWAWSSRRSGAARSSAGIAPTETGISWQGHLIGLVAGVAAAFLFRRKAVA